MFKGECLNPQLSRIMNETGHTDLLCVADAGLPLPKEVERVDLAWKKGNPSWLEVCEMIKANMVIEKIILAGEIQEKNPEMLAAFKNLFPDARMEYIAHENLKQMSKTCRAIVRTGEFSPFCNCIFVAGCNF